VAAQSAAWLWPTCSGPLSSHSLCCQTLSPPASAIAIICARPRRLCHRPTSSRTGAASSTRLMIHLNSRGADLWAHTEAHRPGTSAGRTRISEASSWHHSMRKFALLALFVLGLPLVHRRQCHQDPPPGFFSCWPIPVGVYRLLRGTMRSRARSLRAGSALETMAPRHAGWTRVPLPTATLVPAGGADPGRDVAARHWHEPECWPLAAHPS
jgi:hypothetical protein